MALLLSSVQWFLSAYASYPAYCQIFSYMTENQAQIRYLLSLMGRLVAFTAGLGILWRINYCRLLGILLCSTTILTFYWKHPVFLMEKIVNRLPEYGIYLYRYGIDAKTAASYALRVLYVNDLLFATVFIFIFTRPSVVKQFKPLRDGGK